MTGEDDTEVHILLYVCKNLKIFGTPILTGLLAYSRGFRNFGELEVLPVVLGEGQTAALAVK